eukprot:11209156-Lingulodinium_polyedra.AAC.1
MQRNNTTLHNATQRDTYERCSITRSIHYIAPCRIVLVRAVLRWTTARNVALWRNAARVGLISPR